MPQIGQTNVVTMQNGRSHDLIPKFLERTVPSAVTIMLHFSSERGNSGGCCISHGRGCCCHACCNHPDEKWEMRQHKQWAPMQEWVGGKKNGCQNFTPMRALHAHLMPLEIKTKQTNLASREAKNNVTVIVNINECPERQTLDTGAGFAISLGLSINWPCHCPTASSTLRPWKVTSTEPHA